MTAAAALCSLAKVLAEADIFMEKTRETCRDGKKRKIPTYVCMKRGTKYILLGFISILS